jgi:hypothetical protein
MYRKAGIFFTGVLLLLPSFLWAQITGPAPRSVRLPWPRDDNTWGYDVVIEEELEGEYGVHLREFTHEFFIIVPLPPGMYRYRVIPYNYLGRPEPEQGSAWTHFEVPAFPAPKEDDFPESIVLQDDPEELGDPRELDDPGEPIAWSEFDEPIALQEPAVQPVELPEKDWGARLWTAGVSLGTSFSRPWLIVTFHMTIAPKPFSFLEAGIDLGTIGERYYTSYSCIYPFIHYAFFAPFQRKGGWYIGVGGGFWLCRYATSGRSVEEKNFSLDITTGVNIMNIFDISYTMRTDLGGISHKFSAGYVKRVLGR